MNRALEDVKMVGGRLVEFIDPLDGVEIQEPLQGLTLQTGRNAANHLPLPNLLGRGVGETLYHLKNRSAFDINGKR